MTLRMCGTRQMLNKSKRLTVKNSSKGKKNVIDMNIKITNHNNSVQLNDRGLKKITNN